MIINVNNNSYYVKVIGKGTPIVFFHGFTGSTNSWENLIDLLKDHYKCIAIDLPGHGKTNVQHLSNMEEACEDIHHILNQIGVDDHHLVGYSMGGRTALVFTSLFMKQVKSLILIGASPGLTGNAKIERIRNDEKLAQFIVNNGIEQFVNYWQNIPLFLTHKNLPSNVKSQLRKERVSQNPLGLALSLRKMGTGVQPSLWERLDQINVPTLLVTGSLDEKFTNLNKKMAEKMPNAIHEIVPSVGHAVQLESPRGFYNIINKFLVHKGGNKNDI